MNKFLDFIALDIETTGFDTKSDEIIEIGAVKYIDGKLTNEFSIFIKPEKDVPLFIKQLTNITDEQLESGLKITEALKKLIDFVQNFPIVCHNAKFDIEFILQKFKQHNITPFENDIYDTLILSRIYFPFSTDHKLLTVSEYLDINLTNAHRAIFDAKATGEIFIKTVEFIQNNISLQINRIIYQLLLTANLYSDTLILIKNIYSEQQKNILKKPAPIQIKNRRHNFIENKNKIPVLPSIEEIFGEDSFFEKNFPDYEIRVGQIDMANAVLNNLTEKKILLSEAGTGVGKSLAYLIPSMLYTQKNESKVIISTNTKNLQEQLFYKDIPLIAKAVPLDFSAVLLKGRANYICEKRWREIVSNVEELTSEYEAEALLYLIVWKEITKTGDITENSSFNMNRFAGFWKKIVADRHFCRGRKCSFFSQCYLMSVRLKAEKSNLIIINHHLLISDLNSENSVLGKYEHLIVDEAHNLPVIAPEEFGASLNYYEINNFLSSLFNTQKNMATGQLMRLQSDAVKSAIAESKKKLFKDKIENLSNFITKQKGKFKRLFEKISKFVNDSGSFGKLRIKKIEDFPKIFSKIKKINKDWENFLLDMQDLENLLSSINSNVFANYEENLDNLNAAIKKISEFVETFYSLVEPDFINTAFWLSASDTTNQKSNISGAINLAPLKIGDYFSDFLYQKDISILFTSATLSIRGSFKYFKTKMGLDKVENKLTELIVDSPFDYQKQSAALVPTMLPSPKESRFIIDSLKFVKKVILQSKKGIMILFTSYKDLNYYYENLKDDLYAENILLLAQGKGISRSMMLYEFKKNKKSVLLGTNSFWEGVDIPGEALSILILTKLPFLVPSDPIVEAFIELLEFEGKNSFMHYMLPNALLKYRQGFGRLIRNKTDKGLVIVLDKRVIKTFYGKYFREILPTKTKIILSESQMSKFLQNWRF